MEVDDWCVVKWGGPMQVGDLRKERAERMPLSRVGHRVWCSVDGELILARLAVDDRGVFLERVLEPSRDAHTVRHLQAKYVRE